MNTEIKMDEGDKVAAEIVREILAEDKFGNFAHENDYKGLRAELASYGFTYHKTGDRVVVTGSRYNVKEYSALAWPHLCINQIVADFKETA